MSSEFKSGEGIRILIGQNSDGNSWRIPLTQKSWKNYPRKPSGFPRKKGYGLALLKTWWVFCSHTMESTVRARNIFYANRSIFYSNRNIFSTALIKEARIHDYRNQKPPFNNQQVCSLKFQAMEKSQREIKEISSNHRFSISAYVVNPKYV